MEWLKLLAPFVPLLIQVIKTFWPEEVSRNGRELKRAKAMKYRAIGKLEKLKITPLTTQEEIAKMGRVSEKTPRAEEGGL